MGALIDTPRIFWKNDMFFAFGWSKAHVCLIGEFADNKFLFAVGRKLVADGYRVCYVLAQKRKLKDIGAIHDVFGVSKFVGLSSEYFGIPKKYKGLMLALADNVYVYTPKSAQSVEDVYLDVYRVVNVDDNFFPYRKVTMFDLVMRLKEDKPERVFVDLETDSLRFDSKILMLGITWDGLGETLIVEKPSVRGLVNFFHTLKTGNIILVMHHAIFDLGVLFHVWKKYLGNPYYSIMPHLRIVDTEALASLAGERELSLKRLAFKHLTVPSPLMADSSDERFSHPGYLSEDVRSTKLLYEKFQKSEETEAWKLLSELIPLFAAIWVEGVHVSRSFLRTLQEKYAKQEKDILATLQEYNSEINWMSPSQVARYIETTFDVKGGLRTSSGNLSLAVKSVSLLLERQDQDPKLVHLLQTYKKYVDLRKVEGTFITPYLKGMELYGDERLHPTINYTSVDTGRLACQSPNLQQVEASSELKGIFRSRWHSGKIVECDLSQAELRIAAIISEDDKLADVLLHGDVHRIAASFLFKKPVDEITPKERRMAKTLVFGSLYGGTPYGLAYRLGLPEEQVQEAYDRLFSYFSGLGKWMDRTVEFVLRHKYLRTLFGRVRRFDQYDISTRRGKAWVRRRAINTPIQSAASDVNLWIMREVLRYIQEHKMISRFLVPVHDSILVDVHRDEIDLIMQAFEKAYLSLRRSPLRKFSVFEKLPLEGEFVLGESWGHCSEKTPLYAPLLVARLSSHSGLEIVEDNR